VSRVLVHPASMMLVREVEIGLLESRVVAAHLPHDRSIHARKLVDSADVARRNEVVAIFVLVHTVNVEVVPRRLLVKAITAGVGRRWKSPAHAWVYVVQRAPLKQHIPCLDVHLLEHSLHNPAHSILNIESRVGGQIVLPRLVDSHKRRSPLRVRRHFELVHVAAGARARALNCLDYPVVLVHDHAVSSREPLVLLSLEVAQMVLSLVLAYSRCMRRLWPGGASAGPDQIAIVVVDVRSRIEVSVWREENVAGRYEFGAKNGEVYYGCV